MISGLFQKFASLFTGMKEVGILEETDFKWIFVLGERSDYITASEYSFTGSGYNG